MFPKIKPHMVERGIFSVPFRAIPVGADRLHQRPLLGAVMIAHAKWLPEMIETGANFHAEPIPPLRHVQPIEPYRSAPSLSLQGWGRLRRIGNVQCGVVTEPLHVKSRPVIVFRLGGSALAMAAAMGYNKAIT